ncbi:MAG TPA: helix-turn-helix domain-containing protein [Gammaproteobacteria bacterium]|nr:helix-turn-helix domain-containing protein [Gammaproteobacteria bacterium]
MSMTKAASLAERRNDLTRALILEAAIGVLENGAVHELTVRAVAKRANISERTVFRYFASREAFLDAVAAEVQRRLDLPPPPASLEALEAAPRDLYRGFEARTNLTKAALHSELFPRMRDSYAKERWTAVRRVIDERWPERAERERRIAAANIRYYLAASTWHYYRFYMGLSLKDTIACAETVIRQSLASLEAGAPRAAGGG